MRLGGNRLNMDLSPRVDYASVVNFFHGEYSLGDVMLVNREYSSIPSSLFGDQCSRIEGSGLQMNEALCDDV